MQGRFKMEYGIQVNCTIDYSTVELGPDATKYLTIVDCSGQIYAYFL